MDCSEVCKELVCRSDVQNLLVCRHHSLVVLEGRGLACWCHRHGDWQSTVLIDRVSLVGVLSHVLCPSRFQGNRSENPIALVS